ncbi:MAG: hypothetical protein N2560_00245 [Ignavibacteria bacterium]|nr:hypothetical protein [Ignavibacteria bacterium]
MFSNFKIFVLSFLIISIQSLNFSLLCQEEPNGKKLNGGMGYFMPGVSILNIKDLNSTLASKNYPKFSSSLTSFGGGGHAIISNFIIGGEGHGMFAKEQTTDKVSLNLGAGYGVFNLGYVLFSSGGLMVYPLVGFGGSGISLSLTERYIPKFEQVLDSLKGHVELSTGGFLLHFAIGADFLITFDNSEKAHGGVMVGLRAGFLYSPIAGDWKMDDVKVSGGPEIGLTGAYIRLLIGGGGFGKK